MPLKLMTGNKSYSSWSMRPWIGLRAAGIPFEEEVIPLSLEDSKARMLSHSPAGKVPVLIDGDVHVWESLAILEYAAEKFRDAHLWPSDTNARAHARAISAEMHAGFAALRNECQMNMWRPPSKRATLSADAQANIARIQALWTEARQRFGAGGPFLFGKFSAADAMYAPVVSRFETYAIDVTPPVAAYMQAMIALPAWAEWRRAALNEPWVIAAYEDHPDGPRLKADAA